MVPIPKPFPPQFACFLRGKEVFCGSYRSLITGRTDSVIHDQAGASFADGALE
jgi:hypothetical protein